MQFNPAIEDHYIKFIDEQRDAGEIEVLRNGKLTKAQKLKSTDIIKKSTYKQLIFLDLNKYKAKNLYYSNA